MDLIHVFGLQVMVQMRKILPTITTLVVAQIRMALHHLQDLQEVDRHLLQVFRVPRRVFSGPRRLRSEAHFNTPQYVLVKTKDIS